MMENYFYPTAEEDDKNFLPEEVLKQNEEFSRYINKLLEIKFDYQKRELYQEFIEYFKDAAFDKIIENASDTIKARIFYDSLDNLEYFISLYSGRYKRSIWHGNKLFEEFKSLLPVSIEEWVKYIIEVLEDPGVLRIFVIYDQEKDISIYYKTKIMSDLQDIVDEEDIEKLSEYIKELKSAL